MSTRSSPPPWLLVLALLSFAASHAAAAPIHVPADHATIQAAINAANNGDTIIVADGTYTENINFSGKAITLTSANGPATTIIDGNNASCVVKFVSGETSAAVLSNFTIQRGFDSANCGFEGAGIQVSGASPTITGNIIKDNRGCDGVGIGVGFGSPLIQGNLITGNQRMTCSGGNGGGGISIRGASSAQIIDNTITNNNAGNGVGGGGISLFASGTTIIRGNLISGNVVSTSGGGIGMVNNSPAIISNNIILQNSAAQGGGIAVSVPSGNTGPRIINNTIARNTATNKGSELYTNGFAGLTQIWNNLLFGTSSQAAVFCDTMFNPTPPVLGFNDAFNTTGPAYAGSCTSVTGTNGNISTDPLFVSSTSDFHLQAMSPAIDAGSNTAPNLPTTDRAGDPRVLDGNGDGTATVDMGAFEHPLQGGLALAPTSLTFPGQIVGSSSSPQTVTLTNTGAAPITISGVAVTGDFSQTTTCGASVAPGASCTFQITFTPTGAGNRTGALMITNNAPGSPHSVALTGTGLAPSLALTPTSLTFPGQIVGSSSSPQTVTLTNTGSAPIAISQMAVIGDFSQTTTCGASVAPGASCTFQITFTPTGAGSRMGALTITNNAAGSPHSVALTGTGLKLSLELAPTSLTFPGQIVGAPGSPQTVTLTNTGDVPVMIAEIAVAGDFSQTTTCGASVAPGANCTFAVTFTPTEAGSRTGTLTITNNAPGSPHSVALTGTGQDFSIETAPGGSTSAATESGDTATYHLQVSPAGGFDGTVTLTCAGAPDQADCTVSPAQVTPRGAAAPFTVSVATSASPEAAAGATWTRTPPAAPIAIVGALALIAIGFLVRGTSPSRPRRRSRIPAFAFVLLVSLAFSGCGDNERPETPGTPGTPAGSYELTITGTANGRTHTVSLSLTVR